jgi:hypothetical protein
VRCKGFLPGRREGKKVNEDMKHNPKNNGNHEDMQHNMLSIGNHDPLSEIWVLL